MPHYFNHLSAVPAQNVCAATQFARAARTEAGHTQRRTDRPRPFLRLRRIHHRVNARVMYPLLPRLQRERKASSVRRPHSPIPVLESCRTMARQASGRIPSGDLTEIFYLA